MPLQAFINFKGNCREAVKFYTEAFGLEEPRIMTYAEMPGGSGVSEDEKDYVLHTELIIMGDTVMFADTSKFNAPFVQGNNMGLTVVSKDIDEIKTLWGKMAEGARVDMELQETFWTKCYGMLTDKFGIPWQFSHDGGN